MQISDFDFELPADRIATKPTKERDLSKLLVLGRNSGKIEHRKFHDIIDYLRKGDILVINNSKVFPARLLGHKKDSGGKVEILLNHELSAGIWEVVGKGLKEGSEIIFDNSALTGLVLGKDVETASIKFNLGGEEFFREIEKVGHIPLPPYIEKQRSLSGIGDKVNDREEYQTVYAKPKGSVAAPTAGLHFTSLLLEKIKDRGVEVLEVTLHVGLGTFQPVKTERVEDHKIHKEFFTIDHEVIVKIQEAKDNGRRIVAVGTTTTRVLETVFSDKFIPKSQVLNPDSQLLSGWTDIYLYPGSKFHCIDGMITNFHLPKSSLLLLVSAFAGKEAILTAYKTAIKHQYRFYSYGDAMLII
ncbi:MAG: tRNA preQ1(34) S-adenosylmethionine ribosyltransferase-isomerase QueA [Candidatus Berkelbacteria bacterium]|nr:tRNA preQ1(34) S-adenosylmethionine ribosyltransferase-isomerase QueA [Candidatus Berkelbacteria bacterium]